MSVISVQFANVDFEVVSVRDDGGQLWLLANPFAKVLEYSVLNKAIWSHVSEGNKTNYDKLQPFRIGMVTSSLHPQSKFINRAGLFELIQASRMPKALEFKNWINSVLLPKLCDDGSYDMARDAPMEIGNAMNAVHAVTHDGRYAPWIDRTPNTSSEVAELKIELLTAKLQAQSQVAERDKTIAVYEERISALRNVVAEYDARIAESRQTIDAYEKRMLAVRDVAAACEARMMENYEARLEKMRMAINELTRTAAGAGLQFCANALYADGAVRQNEALRNQMDTLKYRIVPVLDDRPYKDEMIVVYYYYENGRMYIRVRRTQRAEVEFCDRVKHRYTTQGRPPPVGYEWLVPCTKFYEVVCPNAVTVWNKVRMTYTNLFYGLSEENTAKTIFKVLTADEIRAKYAADVVACRQNLKKDAMRIEDFESLQLTDAEHAVRLCFVPHSRVASIIRKVIEDEIIETRNEAMFAERLLDRDTVTFTDEQIAEAANNYRRYLIRERAGLMDFDNAIIDKYYRAIR
ncbi:Bro12 [Heliothis virescens ascovirus 3j]|uniref:Bro12 n=1 Tax=Heliothis virescens ascovirus 3j TaxID=1561067 RepID=A0A2Z5UZH2_9VIRU|nr:Bro12 [Heliothis virescens ascovirus 3j]